MSGMVVLLLGGLFAAGLVWAGLWAMREGFRQGDWAGDASSDVEVLGGADRVTVRATITNPQSTAAMAAVKVAAVRIGRPLGRRGRSTPRRDPDLSQARVLAVDGHGAQRVEWSMVPPAKRWRIIVDVYVWQTAGRARLHRHLCSPRRGGFGTPVTWRTAP